MISNKNFKSRYNVGDLVESKDGVFYFVIKAKKQTLIVENRFTSERFEKSVKDFH